MRSIESLEAWNVANVVARAAYRLTCRRPLSTHFRLAEQIRGAAASIPANLAEGYALGTKRQLIRGVRIALGSTAELRSHLDIARDVGLVRDAEFDDAQLDRLTGLLVGLLKSLGATVGR